MVKLSHLLSVGAAATTAVAAEQWVLPQGLPAGHNGGFRERLVEPAGGSKPHIVFILFDDYGWADSGWHRNYTIGDVVVPATDEVQTPNMDQLVREGINLNRNYVYKYCSPTRSAIQSGRNPYHVNNLNLAPDVYNPNDPVSGMAAVPRNMTGMATKLAAAGYSTGMFGKWDAGMATPDHTPLGRGYQTALHYFHHANDYWSMVAGSCPSAPRPRKACAAGDQGNFCAATSPNVNKVDIFTADADACCDACTANQDCMAWVWGKTYNATAGGHSCHLKAGITEKQQGNCTAACIAADGDCSTAGHFEVVDLWSTPGDGTEGPAHGFNNTCTTSNPNGPEPASCQAGPKGDEWYGGYEDSLFEQHVLQFIHAHDPADPMFLFWAPHIVHAPLQAPQEFIDKFGFMASTDKPEHQRQFYHSMVNFADAAIGNVTAAIKAKGMWNNTVVVFSADNGGPIYANGTAGANNYPLKGGKMNNWEGGIRVNGWISGGLLPESQRGITYNGLTTAWDYYTTFARLAGVDPTDHRAAAANLPPVDGVDHSGLILGSNLTSARRELPIGTEPRVSNVSNAPLCSSYGHSPTYDDSADGFAHYLSPGTGPHDHCTTVSGLIVDYGADGLFKILTGDVQQDVFTGPHYPNSTTDMVSANFVGHCGNGCLFNLTADPFELVDLAADTAHSARLAEMQGKVVAYEATAFNPHRGNTDPAACDHVNGPYGGFWGPFVDA